MDAVKRNELLTYLTKYTSREIPAWGLLVKCDESQSSSDSELVDFAMDLCLLFASDLGGDKRRYYEGEYSEVIDKSIRFLSGEQSLYDGFAG